MNWDPITYKSLSPGDRRIALNQSLKEYKTSLKDEKFKHMRHLIQRGIRLLESELEALAEQELKTENFKKLESSLQETLTKVIYYVGPFFLAGTGLYFWR